MACLFGKKTALTELEIDQIRRFLDALGKSFPESFRLYLLGGSALCLLGNPRPTLDIDYLGDDLVEADWQKEIKKVAEKMGVEVEAVPIQRFLPVPDIAEQRSLYFDTFGSVEVYIFDPYSIALSKIDRGFDTDIDDVVFLVSHKLVTLAELERLLHELLPQAGEFDINPQEMLAHLQEVRLRLNL
jgi:hypothetical protein